MAKIPLLVLIIVPAIGFGGWPVIARFAGTSPAQTNVILMGVTALCMVGWYGKATGPPTLKQLAIMVGAGILNSIALVCFGKLLSEHAKYVGVAQALMPVVGVLGIALVAWTRVPMAHILGLLLIAAGIWLLCMPGPAPIS